MEINNLSQVLDKQGKEFQDYINSLKSTIALLNSRISECDELRQKLNNDKAALKLEREGITRLVNQAAKKDAEANAFLYQSKSREDESARLLKQSEEKLARAKEDARLASEERFKNQELQADVQKRIKLVEMEERRLKLFEHKLNLIAEDKEISKKLKEIE